MKLGEYLKVYRARHNMTMQDLADACGFSKAYIGILEKGVNPTTGKPVSPTIQTFEKIAKGTGQDIDSLFNLLDGDQPVTVKSRATPLTDEQETVLDAFSQLNSEGKNLILAMLNSLKISHTSQMGHGVIQNTQHGNNYFGISGGEFNSQVTMG